MIWDNPVLLWLIVLFAGIIALALLEWRRLRMVERKERAAKRRKPKKAVDSEE